MTETPQTTETTRPRLSDWKRLSHQRGPNLSYWLLASLVAAGFLLYASPPLRSSVLISTFAVLLSPLIFLIGWKLGMSTFSLSCQHYRRLHRTWSLSFLLPAIVTATTGLGLLGGRYWWLFSFGVAFFGHRKGTQRAWWGAVAILAFDFRSDPGLGLRPVAQNDEDALAKAIDAVSEEIGRRSSRRDT